MSLSSENIFFFISCFGTLQGIILAVFVYFHPKSDKSINIFLALYIGSIALVMATPFVFMILPWQKCFFMEAFTFVPGPMMYLYVRSLKESITWRKAFPHLLLIVNSVSVYNFSFSINAVMFPAISLILPRFSPVFEGFESSC